MTDSNRTIRIASRKSQLALVQTYWVLIISTSNVRSGKCFCNSACTQWVWTSASWLFREAMRIVRVELVIEIMNYKL